MAFPKYRGLFSEVNSADEGARRFDKFNSKSLTSLLSQLQIDQPVDGTKASQTSVLVADDDVPPSHSPSLSLSGQQHETEKTYCERCIQRREKAPCEESSPAPHNSEECCTKDVTLPGSDEVVGMEG